MISIIIPARDQIELTNDCISSVLEATRSSEFEILLVNNGSCQEFCQYFTTLAKKDNRLVLIDVPEPFSFSHLCNTGARRAKGAYLFF